MTHEEAILYIKEALPKYSILAQRAIKTLEDAVEYRKAPKQLQEPFPGHIECPRCKLLVTENDHKDTFCNHCGQRLTNLPIL